MANLNLGLNNSMRRIDNYYKDEGNFDNIVNISNSTDITNTFTNNIIQNIEIDISQFADLIRNTKNIFKIENIVCPGFFIFKDVNQNIDSNIDIQNEIINKFKILINNEIVNSMINRIEKDPLTDIFTDCVKSNENLLKTYYLNSKIKPHDSIVYTNAYQTQTMLDNSPTMMFTDKGISTDQGGSQYNIQADLNFNRDKIDNSLNKDILKSLGLTGEDIINKNINVNNSINKSLNNNNKYQIDEFIESTNEIFIHDISCGSYFEVSNIEQKLKLTDSIKKFMLIDETIDFSTIFKSNIDTMVKNKIESFRRELNDLIELIKDKESSQISQTLQTDSTDTPTTLSKIKKDIMNLYNSLDKNGFIKYFEINGRLNNFTGYLYSLVGKVFDISQFKKNISDKIQNVSLLGHMFKMIGHTPESLYLELEKKVNIDEIFKIFDNKDLTNGIEQVIKDDFLKNKIDNPYQNIYNLFLEEHTSKEILIKHQNQSNKNVKFNIIIISIITIIFLLFFIIIFKKK